MTIEQAAYVMGLRVGGRIHSLRRIAEKYEAKYNENPDLAGNQLHGKDLCQEAMLILCGVKDLNEVNNYIRDAFEC
jgi:hypothetical protein